MRSTTSQHAWQFRRPPGYNEFMRVRVLFFGQLREITGVGEDFAELSEGARIEDLYERYGRRFPRLLEFRASVAASINQEYVELPLPALHRR